MTRGAAAAVALGRRNFRPIALRGFGDGLNHYAHSMAWFEDRLYVGVARGNLHLIKRRQPPPQWEPYPVAAPDDPFTLDLSARIMCWDPREDRWEQRFAAPVVTGSDGRPVPAAIGYRGMAVHQGPGDTKPVLYVSSFSPTRGPGPVILRSEDGRGFHEVCEHGFGKDGISAFRSLVSFKGRLYTSPVGATRNRPNMSPWPVVFESRDPLGGVWNPVSEPGFGNPQNLAVFELTTFDGHLYAGAGNVRTGFEIWKTDAEGEPPYRWTKVLHLGAYRGQLNEGVLSFCEFNGALYVGTAIQDGGYDRANKIGPAAGEVIRLWPDDSWDLVVGSPRLTPEGAKIPTGGLMPGFNNFFNGYIWRMCVHEGALYVGTWDWSTFLAYCKVHTWPDVLRNFIETLGVDETIEREGGFDLMGTLDGDEWFAVTKTGFGNRYNCGVRTMVSTPHGLAVGTVNPFGPEAAIKRDGVWRYEDNPRGGTEVWLGDPSHDDGSGDEVSSGQGSGGLYRIQGPSEIGRGRTAPARRRASAVAPEELERTHDELAELKRHANVLAVRPDFLSVVYKYHHLHSVGADNVPKDGPVVLVGNHLGLPVLAGTGLMVEDTLLLSHEVLRCTGRTTRWLADPGWYDTEFARRLCGDTINKLGFVPITVGNGARLLEQGELVGIYPEGQSSRPGYRLRPFFWGFAKMAWLGRAPIVPALMLGPQESRPRIEAGGKQFFLNTYKPFPAEYKVIFLPPIDPREHLDSLDDREALAAFTEKIRGLMQAELDREAATRPLHHQAVALQRAYGTNDDDDER